MFIISMTFSVVGDI